MNKFEAVLILSPEISSQTIKNEIEKFKTLIDNNKGKIIQEEDWGLRDLSYNINKFKKAFYRFLQIETTSPIVKELSKELNQSENLLRYIFIKVREHQELPTKLNNEKK